MQAKFHQIHKGVRDFKTVKNHLQKTKETLGIKSMLCVKHHELRQIKYLRPFMILKSISVGITKKQSIKKYSNEITESIINKPN